MSIGGSLSQEQVLAEVKYMQMTDWETSNKKKEKEYHDSTARFQALVRWY